MEVVFGDADFSSGGRVHKVNSFWLITVVLVVSNGAPNLVGQVGTDGGDAEASMLVLGSADRICAVRFAGAAEICIRRELSSIWLTSNTFTSVPSGVVVPAPVYVVLAAVGLPLPKVLNCAELVSCNGFHILNNFLNNNGFRVCIFDPFVMDSFGGAVE